MLRTAKKNPEQLLAEIKSGDPTAGIDRLFKDWWAVVLDDDDYLLAVGRHSFHNMLASLDRDTRRARDQRRRIKAEYRAAINLGKDRIRTVVLMDLQLPSGKKLRDATFAECGAAGGWFKVLATKGKPSQVVGKVLTEQDLQKLKVR